jgi:hypothetical protein
MNYVSRTQMFSAHGVPARFPSPDRCGTALVLALGPSSGVPTPDPQLATELRRAARCPRLRLKRTGVFGISR